MKNDFRSPLAKAKNSGPAGNGTMTWWLQRVSAVALVPLVIWFIAFIFKITKHQTCDEIMNLFVSPFPTTLLALFIGVGIYHGNIGIKEIIEDYVHCHSIKFSLIILVNLLSFLSAIIGICSIFVYHLSTFCFN